ncbi:hypothetical protein EEB15_18755 [Ramlibacter sp. WS9]|nr:hypothetical protein EEB15_18755 [Ramlibacter sp. WS9]
MEPRIVRHLAQIALLCERFGVSHLELFGSASNGAFDAAHSDYDFLVELDPAEKDSKARRWIEFAEALEQLLGRPVDLVSPRYIQNPFFQEAVNSSRVVIYDRQSAQAAAWCGRGGQDRPRVSGGFVDRAVPAGSQDAVGCRAATGDFG